VAGAEQTSAGDRAKAVALIGAGYGVGAGITALLHGFVGGAVGFRGVFAMAIVPLVGVVALRRRIQEPDRFSRSVRTASGARFGRIDRVYLRRLVIVAGINVGVAVITAPANGFLFVYAQNILHLSGLAVGGMVAGGGLTGLAGLIIGRWLADHLGRRPTGSGGLVALAGCGVAVYSGSRFGLIAGYLLGVLSGATFAPAMGALATELFPTRERASAAGWVLAVGILGGVCGLFAFGAIADVGDRFRTAALAVFAPAALAALLFWLVPETRGREPEEVSPEGDLVAGGAGIVLG
jgi:MFS family permease